MKKKIIIVFILIVLIIGGWYLYSQKNGTGELQKNSETEVDKFKIDYEFAKIPENEMYGESKLDEENKIIEYPFVKEELKGKSLKISYKISEDTPKEDFDTTHIEFSVTDGEIEAVEINKIRDDNNLLIATADEDTHGFSLEMEQTKSLTNVKYSANVTFKVDEKRYTISKELDLSKFRKLSLGCLQCRVLNNEGEAFPDDTAIYLEELDQLSGEIVTVLPKMTLKEANGNKYIPIGKYRFYIIQNDEKIYTDEFNLGPKEDKKVNLWIEEKGERTEIISLGRYLHVLRDKDKNPVEGIEFNLYDEDKKLVETAKTNKKGLLGWINMNYGKYYLKQAGIENGEFIELNIDADIVRFDFEYDKETNIATKIDQTRNLYYVKDI